MSIFHVLFLFSAGAIPVLANIDPIQVEGNELIAPGIYARSSVAEDVRSLNIVQEISELYNSFQSTTEKGRSVALVQNTCFALYIKTENGLPEFIDQISVKDKKCVGN